MENDPPSQPLYPPYPEATQPPYQPSPTQPSYPQTPYPQSPYPPTQYPQAPYPYSQPVAQPPASPPKKSRRTLWIVLGTLGGLLVLCCVISGIAVVVLNNNGTLGRIATATATTSPTATPALNATFTSTDGVYKISYPGAWKAEPLTIALTSGTAQIGSATGNDLVLVEPFTFKSAATYPHILTSAISGSPFTNSKVDSAVTTRTYPSGSWTVASGTTETSGLAFTVRLYGILHNNRTFIIITFAPTSSATADQTTYLDPILTSLVFLK